jgi:hypothetical protein
VKANVSTPASRNSISNLPIDDWLRLSYQLIQPLLNNRAVAALIHVDAVGGTRRLPVNRHAETYGDALSWRTHHEMKVPRVKATHDPAVGTAEDGCLPAHRPLASQRPLIERDARRGRVAATPIQFGTAGRHEVVGALVADVILRRSQTVPIRRRLHAAGIDRHGALADAGGARFRQQSLNDLLGPVVLTLAEVMLANLPTRIDEVKGRPILILECPPDRIVVVDRDRILDPHLPHGSTNVVDVLFESEFGCVHADHDELLPVLLRPGAHIRKRAQPVDAGIGPEVDDDHLPDEILRLQGWRIDPVDRAAKGGQLPRRAIVRFHLARLRQGFGEAGRSAFGAKAAEHAEVRSCNGHCRPPWKASSIVVDCLSHVISPLRVAPASTICAVV